MPTLFISHGSPMLAIEDCAARRFLRGLGARLPRPQAIVVFSAHHDDVGTSVTGAEHPETIHDFGGFPRELYRLRYAAPGDGHLAHRLATQLTAAALPAEVDMRRGLDHGAWIPLLLIYPRADVPVLQVSIDSAQGPAHHFALGRALRALRDEGVLVIGSGGVTHNLRAYFHAPERSHDAPPAEWVEAFNEWTAGVVVARRFDDLQHYAERAPYAPQNHPTPEHFLPLFTTLGAAFDDEPGRRIHASYDRGLLSLDAYAFGAVADAGTAAAVLH